MFDMHMSGTRLISRKERWKRTGRMAEVDYCKNDKYYTERYGTADEKFFIHSNSISVQ